MILVVSHAGDGHLLAVTDRLDAAGADWALLDTDQYPSVSTLVDGPHGASIQTSERTLRLGEVRAVWWRRPRPPLIPGRSPEVTRWAARQAFAALDSALNAIDSTWVNHPRCNRRAEDKPANLRRAAALGLQVPAWCVTNEKAAALDFAELQRDIVVKPVDSAHVPGAGDLWTRRLEDHHQLGRLGPEPYLLQRFINKTEDVRAVVVGEQVFAVAIESQATAATSVDLRAGDLRALKHRTIELPSPITQALRALCAALELQFAAIDLCRDDEGRLWFLELNPNGQWAWLQELAGAPIAEALAQVLSA